MSDVFISYARADEAMAQVLVERLTALGLDVWWDRMIPEGVAFEPEIERRLKEATAVVVVWSAASVDSAPVRAEAREALRLGTLTPISIDGTEPPLFFREFQFRDLSGWGGGAEEPAFQQLAIQVVARVKGQEAAAAMPFDGKTAPAASFASQSVGPFRSLGSYLTLIGIFATYLAHAAGFDLFEFFGSYWGVVLATAAFAIALFEFAERDLTRQTKALVARWLRPEPEAEPIRAANAFLAMFEAVFTKRHFSLGCFWRSAVASVAVYLLLILTLVDLETLHASIDAILEAGVGAKSSEVAGPIGLDRRSS